MKPTLAILRAAGAALWLAGCASYESSVSEAQPHAVIRFVRPADSSFDQGTVVRFDGRSVRRGKDYRVSPGRHEVVMEVSEQRVESYRPVTLGGSGAAAMGNPATLNVSPSGQASTAGVQPFGGMQPVNLNMESRQRSEMTNVLTLEVGWLYEFDGYELTRLRPPK